MVLVSSVVNKNDVPTHVSASGGGGGGAPAEGGSGGGVFSGGVSEAGCLGRMGRRRGCLAEEMQKQKTPNQKIYKKQQNAEIHKISQQARVVEN